MRRVRELYSILNTTSGFSLTELVVATGVSAIVLLISATVTMTSLDTNVNSMRIQAIATYRDEVFYNLRKLDSAGKSVCLNILSTNLNGNLSALISAAESATATSSSAAIDIPLLNLTGNSNFPKYGDLIIKSLSVDKPRLISKINAYAISEPKEFALAGATKISDYVIQVNLISQLALNSSGSAKPFSSGTEESFLKAVNKLNLVISGTNLVDCSTEQPSRSTALAEACSAFGDDVIYVHDDSGGPGTGQCYLPIYDPGSGYPSYGTANQVAVTGYTPLRGFFCEGAVKGKIFDSSVCTGYKD